MKFFILFLILLSVGCQSQQVASSGDDLTESEQEYFEKWDKAIAVAKEDLFAEVEQKMNDDDYLKGFQSTNSEYQASLFVKKYHSSLASYHTAKLIQLVDTHSFLWVGEMHQSMRSIARTKIPELYAKILHGAYQQRVGKK